MGLRSVIHIFLWWLVAALIISLVIAISLGFRDADWSLACWQGDCKKAKTEVQFFAAYTDDDGHVDNPQHDPQDDGIDPGYEKAVGRCDAEINPNGDVHIWLRNVYPSYRCRLWVVIKNTGCVKLRVEPLTIISPHEVTVESLTTTLCTWIHPNQRMLESFSIHVEQEALQSATYHFRIKNNFTYWKQTCGCCSGK